MNLTARKFWRFRVIVILGALSILGLAESAPAQKPYDLLIRGGTVVDGSGAPRFTADVALKGDRIVRIERSGIPADQAATVLDAEGLVIAPGFIDNHAHISINIHEFPLAENFTHREGLARIQFRVIPSDGRYDGKTLADTVTGGKPGRVLKGPARRVAAQASD